MKRVIAALALVGLLAACTDDEPDASPASSTETSDPGDTTSSTVAPATGPDAEGVVVSDVDGNTDAGQKVRVGDVILEIGGAPVRTPEDLANGVRDANKMQRRAVLLRVRSGNETRFVAIQLKRG